MSEMTTIPVDELARLNERAKKLAQEKSYLQLVIRLMNRVSSASGLEDTVDCMMRNILDVVGGENIILYYWIDGQIFSADVFGRKMRLDVIDDELVQKVLAFQEPIEVEHDFSDTLMMTTEFSNAYTWVYPLLVGTELIGILKMESLSIGMHELYDQLPTFYNYAALVLKNEILGHTRLKQANDRLTETNKKLEMEVEERTQVEEQLRAARDELESRVAERTAALNLLNEQLHNELAERIRAESALRDSTEEIHDLYNRAPCGYHSLDADGLIVRINDTELKWFGYSREELLGKKKFSDLVTGRSLKIFQDNFPIFKEQGWVKDIEFEIIRRDGSILPVLLSATALYDNAGAFLMSRSTIYDMSEYKKVQETEHLLSSIVQSSDDAIIGKDLNEIILSWNKGAERIYGYSAEETIGQSVAMLVPPERLDELSKIMAAIKLGERIDHSTTQRVRKDGQKIFVSLTVSPIKDAAGNIVAASAIARDITDQIRVEEENRKLNAELEQRVEARTVDLEEKRGELLQSQKALMNIVEDLNEKSTELENANSKLRELDRLKSMFIASMSHELRTPLNSIIGFSSILHNEWLGQVNAEQKENLATIQRSGKHLLSLINDVIDVSKIEAGKIDSQLEEFDLHDLLTEAVNFLEKDISEKSLELHLQPHHLLLNTDRRRLLQCIVNLLSNAVKFSEQGSVSISSFSGNEETGEGGDIPPGYVSISVSDTGIGISDEDIPRLFQPFIRLVSPLKTVVPGTGLGLYLTRKLVQEILKGDILCTSRIGEGSTFTIRIPESLNEKGTGHRGQ